jgi:hypothetical protein
MGANASEQTKMAARDYEDYLQVSMAYILHLACTDRFASVLHASL